MSRDKRSLKSPLAWDRGTLSRGEWGACSGWSFNGEGGRHQDRPPAHSQSALCPGRQWRRFLKTRMLKEGREGFFFPKGRGGSPGWEAGEWPRTIRAVTRHLCAWEPLQGEHTRPHREGGMGSPGGVCSAAPGLHPKLQMRTSQHTQKELHSDRKEGPRALGSEGQSSKSSLSPNVHPGKG